MCHFHFDAYRTAIRKYRFRVCFIKLPIVGEMYHHNKSHKTTVTGDCNTKTGLSFYKCCLGGCN